MKSSLKSLLRKVPLMRSFLQGQEKKEALAWNINAMQHLRDFEVSWMPWTGSSIRPSSIKIILNEIRTHGRKSFIEFGSGISTLYLAEAARRWGGSLISVEQDEQWQEIIAGALREAGTSEFVEFIHAPLETKIVGGTKQEWYSEGHLNARIEGKLFDLVLVDAPISRPGYSQVRAPAGAWVKDHLESDFCIFLDDIHRSGEQAIARDWVKAYNWKFRDPWPRAEVAIFRPQRSTPYNIV